MKKLLLTPFLIIASVAFSQFQPSQTNTQVPHVVQGNVVLKGKVIIDGGNTGTSTLVGITLSPDITWISPSGHVQYTATGKYQDGSTADVTSSCNPWTSSSPSIATINSTGLATGVASNASPTNITCTDPVTGVVSSPATLHVSVITITTTTCPSGTQNTVYAGCNLALTGGTAPYTWSVDTLPAGLSLNTSTGAVTGTPTVVGTSTSNFSVVDTNGISDGQAISFTVAASATLTLQPATFPQANSGLAYGPFVQIGTGGSGNYLTAPAACSITAGALPTTITITNVSNGCQYQTTSTVTAANGTYTGTAQLKDSAGNTATQSFSITVGSGTTSSYTSPRCHQSTSNTYSCPATGSCDCNAWPIASVPNFGGLTGKATCVNDARTGNRVMRLTDSSLSTSIIHNDDAGDSYTLNSDDSMAFVSNIGGTFWVIPFNFGACTVGTAIKIPFHGQFWWDPDLRTTFYGINSLSSTVMQKCTVNTSNNTISCNPLFDFADNSGSTPHGSGGLLPGYNTQYIASPDGFSFYDGGTTYNPHHIWGLIFAGGPAWSKNGPYGTAWQINWVAQPVNNNAGQISFRVTSCSGSCVGGSVEPNWATCTTTCVDGNITWTSIGQHNSQDEPDDLVYYDSAANCFTHIDLLIGYVINTNCAGQSTGALTYLHTGQPAAAAGKTGAHGGGATPNSGYMQWDYSGSWRYVWAPGSMTVDYCQSSVGFCDAHSAIGSVGYYAWSGGIRLHPWNNINSAGSYPVLFNPHSGHKFSYNNVVSGDTTPICSNTTAAGHFTLSYTALFFGEVDCFPTDGSGNIWRFFQTYNSMVSWSYHVQDSSTQNSRTGQHLLFTTDLEGTLGSDKGHNTCTAGQAGCAQNTTTGDTCIIGGDGWKLSTAYTTGTVVSPGIVISTSGYPQAKGNPGHYAFVATNNGTSSSSNTISWCQSPPTSWGAGNGCQTVDNNITWRNIGQLDCRGDVFIGALN